MRINRRDLGKLALALPAALGAKPNSKFGGVQVGINAPYSFHNLPASADDVEKYCVDLGLSAVELRSQPVEEFFGCPIHYSTGAAPRPLFIALTNGRKKAVCRVPKKTDPRITGMTGKDTYQIFKFRRTCAVVHENISVSIPGRESVSSGRTAGTPAAAAADPCSSTGLRTTAPLNGSEAISMNFPEGSSRSGTVTE